MLPVASAADDTLTEGQLQAWMEGKGSLSGVPTCPMCIVACLCLLELFLVEVSGEGVRGQYWLSFGKDRLSVLDHTSKVMRWEWSLKDVQEFTLETYKGQKRLSIRVGRWVISSAVVTYLLVEVSD